MPIDNATLADGATLNYLNVPTQFESDYGDERYYEVPEARANWECTGNVTYSHQGGSMFTLSDVTAAADYQLPFEEPTVSIQGDIYYGSAGNENFNSAIFSLGLSERDARLMPLIGYYCTPTTIASSTLTRKDCQGGSVVDENEHADFRPLSGYVKYDANLGYVEKTNNWSRIAYAAQRLPLRVGNLPKPASNSRMKANSQIPDINVVVANHYPVLLGTGEAASTQLVTVPTRTTVKVENPMPTGVDDLMVGGVDADAEYFNLQGMRIAQPEAGNVYIVRRGAAVAKQLVR